MHWSFWIEALVCLVIAMLVGILLRNVGNSIEPVSKSDLEQMSSASTGKGLDG